MLVYSPPQFVEVSEKSAGVVRSLWPPPQALLLCNHTALQLHTQNHKKTKWDNISVLMCNGVVV